MESSRRLIVLLVIGVVVAFGVVAARSFLGSKEPAAPEAPKEPEVRIIIAKRDIAQGATIQPLQDLDWQTLKQSEAQEGQLREGSARLEDFERAFARRSLRAGEPVTPDAMTRPGEGSLMSAVLGSGMRAVSIAVNSTSGNAGFISPGDRVDLIVTHRIRDNVSGASPDGAVVSETFVRDVRVIAVDQMLENPENKAMLAKTITLEVSPRQAEQIAVAGDLGKISFSLRSLARSDDKPQPPPGGEDQALTDLYGAPAVPPQAPYTRDSDISRALATDGNISATIRVIRGDQTESLSLK